MQKSKTYTVLTRGVKKADRNKLKRIAKQTRLSVNSIMLNAIDDYLDKFPKSKFLSLINELK